MRQVCQPASKPTGKHVSSIYADMPKKPTIDAPTRERISAWLRHSLWRLKPTGIDQRQMAKRLGVHEGTMSKILNGRGSIGLDFVLAMVRRIPLDPALLLEEDPTDKRFFQAGSENLPHPGK